jgi:hypothetical protein
MTVANIVGAVKEAEGSVILRAVAAPAPVAAGG